LDTAMADDSGIVGCSNLVCFCLYSNWSNQYTR
jgi:hypothetical protein